MTKHKQGSSGTGEAGVSSARRRLMQGALAAPAVLTLHNGAALAASSSQVQCAANQVAHPQAPPPSPTTDTYVRVQVLTLTNPGGAGVRYFLKGDDIAALVPANGVVRNDFLRAGQWQELGMGSDGATVVTVTFEGAPFVGEPTWGQNRPLRNGVWLALRFDVDLNVVVIVGIADPYSSGSALAGTCWSSVAPAA